MVRLGQPGGGADASEEDAEEDGLADILRDAVQTAATGVPREESSGCEAASVAAGGAAAPRTYHADGFPLASTPEQVVNAFAREGWDVIASSPQRKRDDLTTSWKLTAAEKAPKELWHVSKDIWVETTELQESGRTSSGAVDLTSPPRKPKGGKKRAGVEAGMKEVARSAPASRASSPARSAQPAGRPSTAVVSASWAAVAAVPPPGAIANVQTALQEHMEQQLGLALVQHQQKLEEQQKQLAEQQRVHQRLMAERLAEQDKKLRDELAAAERIRMQEMRDTIRTSVDAAQQATNASVDAKLDTICKALAHLPQLAALAGAANAENGAGAPAPVP